MADQLDNRPVFTTVMGANGAAKSAWQRANRDRLPERYFAKDSIADSIGRWNTPSARERTHEIVDAQPRRSAGATTSESRAPTPDSPIARCLSGRPRDDPMIGFHQEQRDGWCRALRPRSPAALQLAPAFRELLERFPLPSPTITDPRPPGVRCPFILGRSRPRGIRSLGSVGPKAERLSSTNLIDYRSALPNPDATAGLSPKYSTVYFQTLPTPALVLRG